MKHIIAILILTVMPLFASEIPDFPFTVVEGTAQRKIKPDTVGIDIELLAYNKSSEVSFTSINNTMKAVLEVLQKNGIALTDLVATDLQKKTIRNEKDGNNLDVIGYQISRDISFDWNKIDKYPVVAAELVKIDGVSKVSADFNIQKEAEMRLSLVSEACKNANKKADILATGLGVKLGEPYAIKESDFNSSWTQLFGIAETNDFAMGFGGGSSASQNSFFVPQFIDFKVSVDVIYKLTE